LEASLLPPQEKGMIWSYSKLTELPQHRQLPPSLAKTIRFVVCEMFLFWEKHHALKSSNEKIRPIFFMVLFILDTR
jgi:hypothetical protein